MQEASENGKHCCDKHKIQSPAVYSGWRFLANADWNFFDFIRERSKILFQIFAERCFAAATRLPAAVGVGAGEVFGRAYCVVAALAYLPDVALAGFRSFHRVKLLLYRILIIKSLIGHMGKVNRAHVDKTTEKEVKYYM